MKIHDLLESEGLGLTIFDIDETLMRTTAKIKVVKDGKVIRSLTNQEFNNYKLQPGEQFDFGEFRNAEKFRKESEPIGPMIAKLKAILRNAGNSKVIMLTARADFDDKETFLDTFRDLGIDMSRVHVHRAGNLPGSPAESKAVWIRKYLDTGKYSRVRLYDDSMGNIRMFNALAKEYPNVKFFPYLVTHEGGIKTVREKRVVAYANENSANIKYKTPNFNSEWEEAERYPEFRKIGKDAWIELAGKGKAVTIRSAKDINNTDAADPDSFASLDKTKQGRALDQLKSGTVEMPIVAVYSDGWKELVGGNTRLTAMMAQNGEATVWVFKVPDEVAELAEKLKEDGRIVKGVNTTVDVGLDEIKRQAAKFGNTVDKNGFPPFLRTDGKNQEIKYTAREWAIISGGHLLEEETPKPKLFDFGKY
jgi:hypothetical protein